MEMISIIRGLIMCGEKELAGKMLSDMIRTEIGLEELERYVDTLGECKKVG